ncbi:hypothetical protein [Halogeometricum limi]|uniref:Uncharacterized protein n=1 Tax=Halogeometricum limi TaxID=555875 RepID=A0A1I6GHQ7_9EURY|nr:hypothetical protein [Halogeometricum limi]SFR41763.1 hypothetical protein SAMN04488124_1067 [Halogeometricum limi]
MALSRPGALAVEDARMRMTLDTDRGVVAGGSGHVRATRTNESGAVTSRWETEFRYEVRVDVAVDRPDSLGAPSVSEWAWRVLAY